MKREPKRGLTFSPAAHRYRLDGQPVPGVTTIIKDTLDKPAIPKWAAKTVASYVAENPDAVETLRTLGETAMVKALADVPWKRRDDAGQRGTTIHDIAERLLLDEEVDVPDELVPAAENLLAFFDAWKVEPILLETAVASREHWYAGTFDLIADVTRPDNGERVRAILDYKSGRAIYPEAAWQLAAYAGAEFHARGADGEEHPVPEVSAAFGVHVRTDGYDVHELAHGPAVFDEFLSIRRCYDVVKRGRGDWKVPGSGHVSIAIQVGSAA